jgi:L-rhamnose mutarotase
VARVCSTLQVRADRLAEYRRRHADVRRETVRATGSRPVDARRQADMAPFVDLPDGRPDRGMQFLDLVLLDLDAQLAAAGETPSVRNGARP